MNKKAVGLEKLIILKENRLPYFKTKIIMFLHVTPLIFCIYYLRNLWPGYLEPCSWSLGLYKTANLIGIWQFPKEVLSKSGIFEWLSSSSNFLQTPSLYRCGSVLLWVQFSYLIVHRITGLKHQLATRIQWWKCLSKW